MQLSNRHAALAVFVSALGYFVDVYDLILFSVVRTASLIDLGLSGDDLLSTGVYLLNMQMTGMLLGGILWGVWGDKRGRVSVLFGSILLYSLANILNGFVTSVDSYAACRLIAGIGLAGELGAGITLVSESMSKEHRGYGTTIVATVGVAGAVVAALVGDLVPWRVSYFIGGGLGLSLLGLRILVHESGMFQAMRASEVTKGNLLLLVRDRVRFLRYIKCIVIGLPIWAVIGVIITFSPEIGTALGVSPTPSAGKAVFYSYVGLVLGDLASGLISQRLRSRKKAVFLFLFATLITSMLTLCTYHVSLSTYYFFCLLLGLAVGYWAVFVTTASEQFGTNLRATVTTTVPNFVRGSVVPVTSLFKALAGVLSSPAAALIVVSLSLVLAFWSVFTLEESFAKDLDFVEI